MPTIIATYPNVEQANGAVKSLLEADIPRERISIATSEQTYNQYLKDQVPGGGAQEVGESLAGGILTGGTVGALAGFFVGLSAILLPAIGPLFVTGPLAASLLVGNTLTGAAVGGSAGAAVGVAEGLVAAGVNEGQAESVETALKRGEVLVSVEDDASGQALQILEAARPSSELVKIGS